MLSEILSGSIGYAILLNKETGVITSILFDTVFSVYFVCKKELNLLLILLRTLAKDAVGRANSTLISFLNY